MENIQLKPYETCYYETDVPRGIVNVQPAYAAMIDSSSTRFKLRLPKIPVDIYNKIVSLFKKYAQLYNVECLARVLWDIDEERYCLVVPFQQVSISSVYPIQQEHDEWLITHIPVLEIHSHGVAFDAFWSGIDDADEVHRHLLYGVFSFQRGINEEEQCLFRCCNGSPEYIIPLRKENLFEDGAFEYEAKFVKSIMDSERINIAR